MSTSRISVVLTIAVALAGCSSLPSPADLVDKPSPGNFVGLASHNKFVDHPSAAVSGPASLGLGLGTIIGIPIMVAALPITLALGITAFTDDAKVSNLEVLGNAIAFPDAVCAVGGAYALGSLPYAIVGPSTRAPSGRALSQSAPPSLPPPPVVDKSDGLPPPPRFSPEELGGN